MRDLTRAYVAASHQSDLSLLNILYPYSFNLINRWLSRFVPPHVFLSHRHWNWFVQCNFFLVRCKWGISDFKTFHKANCRCNVATSAFPDWPIICCRHTVKRCQDNDMFCKAKLVRLWWGRFTEAWPTEASLFLFKWTRLRYQSLRLSIRTILTLPDFKYLHLHMVEKLGVDICCEHLILDLFEMCWTFFKYKVPNVASSNLAFILVIKLVNYDSKDSKIWEIFYKLGFWDQCPED